VLRQLRRHVQQCAPVRILKRAQDLQDVAGRERMERRRLWRVLRCVARQLRYFTLRCAAAIETPLSLLGMLHTDENAMHCTLAYMPSHQKIKAGEKAQDKQTVKFEGARSHAFVVGVALVLN
jgi:hypothetical protein